ncbi:MAG: toll/interleukin-1 receptor domain-containing protein [Chitinophagaceae bacterium]
MPQVNLFISYSHKDKEQYIPELLSYVNEQNCSKINIWYDEKISPGNEWDDAIKSKLNTADIVLLLLSQSFLMSKYVRENELTVAISRHKAGECRVIPIFIRKCFLDNYQDIKGLQGLPRDMSFLSDMGEEKWGHYTEIVQQLNDIAHEIETNRNISKSIDDNNDKAGSAKAIEQLCNKRKIFLSIPDSEEGKKKRRDLIIQVEGKIKYEGWPYEVVPGILEANELYKKSEKEISDCLSTLISDSLYSIHIVTSENDLISGVNKLQYDIARNHRDDAFFKSIIWLLNADIKSRLEKEVTMNPITTGNDYDNIFELIKSLDADKEKKLSLLKKSFSEEKKIYMFYDFSKDHNSDLRIKLKSKIEENENLAVRFSMPNASLEKEKEELDKCEGGCIFYGATDPQWFVYRQSILLDAGYTLSKAVCVDEPEIDMKIQRDVSKNAFMIIKGRTDLDYGVKNFLERLKNKV